MEGFLQEAIDLAKGLAEKVSPVLDWVAVRVGEYIDISPDNIHTFLILAISLWVSSKICDEKGIKFWAVGGLLFLGLRYLGL